MPRSRYQRLGPRARHFFEGYGCGMSYRLIPAEAGDRPWVDELRRSVSAELFESTFGGWDEARHRRHCAACWERGGIWLVVVEGRRSGVLQLEERDGEVEICEIQIARGQQNQGLGTRLIEDVLAKARISGSAVVLRVGHKNEDAQRLYARLGFVATGSTASHVLMRAS